MKNDGQARSKSTKLPVRDPQELNGRDAKYERPRVSRVGNLRDLVQGSTGSVTDGAHHQVG